ncbi:MAG: MFS transporter [Pseudomonadota bacterium]|jgi:BCD family chlorophyll transporter-like MFS transporter
MSRTAGPLGRAWARLGPRFLPFADAASADLPLARLLRLSLFQVAVGMALVLLVGTLNRVMIVELGVPAALVAIMVSLPVLYAPMRALVGFRSDHHRSALGWRRVPFMWMGTLIQFGGLAIMPFALLVLSGAGQSDQWPTWIGQLAAGLAFLLVGAGVHTTQTAGLALATDLVAPRSQPRVVGLMYVMLLLGSMGSAVLFGWLLSDFSPGRLVQVIQGSAVATLVLNGLALWKQETRRPGRRRAAHEPAPGFIDAWRVYAGGPNARRRLLAIGLGTLAFGMQDVLLEPYGGQVLSMSIGSTTLLTATLALGGLAGFAFASVILSRGTDAFRMAIAGAAVGIPAFMAISLAAPAGNLPLFALGVLLVGVGGGLFGHGTLTATMQHAPPEHTGLALGAWGAVQATAAGLGVVLGGILRDVVNAIAGIAPGATGLDAATGYLVVYCAEMALLVVTLLVMLPLANAATGSRLLHPPVEAGSR